MNPDNLRPNKTGALWPFGIPVSMSWLEIGAILFAIQEFNVVRVIEIGVEHGGLASILIERSQNENAFHYLGIEIERSKIDIRVAQKVMKSQRSELVFADVFEYLDFIRVIVAATEGVCLVLADGGNKPKEVSAIEPLLRPGDLLMAHDFGKEIFEEDIPKGVSWLQRPYLKDTRLILMQKK